MTSDKNRKELLIKNYVNSLQLNLNVAAFTHCPETWREIDYIPSYNKLYYICDGEGWLRIGDKVYYPRPGQIFLMPAGILQSFSAISKNTFKKYWCHFTATVGDLNLFDIIKLPYCVNVTDKQLLENIFHDLILNYQSNQLSAVFKVKSALYTLISYYLDNTIVEDVYISNSPSVEKLNSVIRYIETHLSENITVEALAEIVHFHPNYFIKFFKKHLGSSPIHYINKIRLEKAKMLLNSDSITIGEVAETVGIKDIYHFSKAFKSFSGFSPSEFRKINQD